MPTLAQIPRWVTLFRYFTSPYIPLKQLNKFWYKNGLSAKLFSGASLPMIITADPDFAQHVMLKNKDNYRKSSRSFGLIRKFLGNGLLNSEGDYWQKQRKMILPGFHRSSLKKIFGLMEKVTEDYLNEIDITLQVNPETDICEVMLELTLRVIANAIFGSNLKNEELNRINRIMPRLQSFILKMIVKPYLKGWYKLTGQLKAHENLSEEERAIIRSYIEKRRKDKDEHQDLLQMLMDIHYEDTGEGMTNKQLIDEINILFLAGHDTSAKAMSWAWYLLAEEHPEVMQKVREEVEREIPDGKVTFDRLSKLEYTQRVLEETLRLYPPIYGTNRMALEDDEFKGIKIPKGTTCGTYIYGLHHSPQLWENPEKFDPERFTKENKKGRHTFAFIPFGGGPRFCLGRQFALMEMKMIMAKMTTRYDMELSPNQKIEPVAIINLYPKNGLKMKISKREQQTNKAAFHHDFDMDLDQIPAGCACPFAAPLPTEVEPTHA